MAQNDIELDITLNDEKLLRSLNLVEKELNSIDKEAAQAGKNIDKAFGVAEKGAKDLNKEIDKVQTNLKQTDKAGGNVGNGLIKGLKGMRSEMRLFNTIPGIFGMVGSAITKIGLAVDFYNDTFNASTLITKAAAAATEDATKAFIKESGTLNDLKKVVESETTSKKDKLLAIDALKTQFPGYFNNLTLENAKTGELKKGYDAATIALIENGKAKLQNQITEQLQLDLATKALAAQAAIKKRVAFESIQVFTLENLAAGETLKIQESLAISAAKTAKAALDGKEIAAVVSGVFDVLAPVAAQVEGITDVTTKGLEELGVSAEKTAEKNKILAGSISDIESKLSKVNAQINEQTKAGDVTALTPLVAQAEQLTKDLEAANAQLDALRTPKAVVQKADIGGDDRQLNPEDVLKIREKALDESIALQEANLRQVQSLELLRLKQAGATEEQITANQAKQERERQKLALQTEQQRLLFIQRFGVERTQAEQDATKAQLAAITSELESFGIEAQAAVGTKRKSFFEFLGLDPDTPEGSKAIAGIEKGVGMAIDGLSDLFQQQEQIAQQEIALRNDNISRLQTDLANELQLNEQGFASNVQLKQKQLKEEEAAREKALASQKKAQTAQLILDTITQTANLITAASEIFSSFAALPFGIGIPIAAGVVGAMVAAFVASKVAAFQAVKLHDGGQLPTVGAGGISDKNGGEGHRIEGTNFVVGGGEFITNEDTTSEHLGFLERLNNDEFKGVDLSALVDGKSSRIRSMNRNVDAVKLLAKIDFSEAIEKQTKAITLYLHKMYTDPKITPLSDGSMLEVKKDLKGNRIITKIKKR